VNQLNPARIASIDILRGLTMLLMIWVNDFWSLEGVPKWLLHTKANEDGMGFSDVIFPAFLVIVGLSVPLSIANRQSKGEATASILLHIILRSFALLVMGLFLVNGENISETASGMPRLLWNTLACLAFIFIWNAYPPAVDRRLVWVLKIIGWLLLLVLAWLYRGGKDGSLHFSTFWWGILGLIGWGYLISALVYVTCRSNIIALSVFWIACLAYSAAFHSGVIPDESLLRTLFSPFGDGAMPALVTSGIITSVIFIRYRPRNKPLSLIGLLLAIGVILAAAGIFLNRYWPISKILATPPWVLICSGITVAAFALIYWLADVQNKSAWFKPVRPAGTNTLLTYLLPYFAYALVYGLLRYNYPETISVGMAGLLKSFLFAFIIVQIAGLLGKAGVRLKL